MQGDQQIKQEPFPEVTEPCSKEEQIIFPRMRCHGEVGKGARLILKTITIMYIGFRNAVGGVFRHMFKYLKMHMFTS